MRNLKRILKLSKKKVTSTTTALDEFKKYLNKEKKIRRKSRAVGGYIPIGVYSFTNCPVPFYTTVSKTSYDLVGELILNPYILNWVKPEESQIKPGFRPAKLILVAQLEKISKPSQITGIYYNTRETMSFTLPFGKPKSTNIPFELYITEVIMGNVDKRKFRVRIRPEFHPV